MPLPCLLCTHAAQGVLCNWLVNLGVWLALAARDLTGKAVGVYLPVSAFVTLGTEQVIANQVWAWVPV